MHYISLLGIVGDRLKVIGNRLKVKVIGPAYAVLSYLHEANLVLLKVLILLGFNRHGVMSLCCCFAIAAAFLIDSASSGVLAVIMIVITLA